MRRIPRRTAHRLTAREMHRRRAALLLSRAASATNRPPVAAAGPRRPATRRWTRHIRVTAILRHGWSVSTPA